MGLCLGEEYFRRRRSRREKRGKALRAGNVSSAEMSKYWRDWRKATPVQNEPVAISGVGGGLRLTDSGEGQRRVAV
jgi:hypothetical protein